MQPPRQWPSLRAAQLQPRPVGAPACLMHSVMFTVLVECSRMERERKKNERERNEWESEIEREREREREKREERRERTLLFARWSGVDMKYTGFVSTVMDGKVPSSVCIRACSCSSVVSVSFLLSCLLSYSPICFILDPLILCNSMMVHVSSHSFCIACAAAGTSRRTWTSSSSERLLT